MENVAGNEPTAPWGRATLVAGKAAVQRWTIDGTKPSTRLVVGRELNSDWQVDSEGVSAAHFALHWNGQALWVVPIGGSFTQVNGEVLSEAMCVTRTTWVEFGGAVMIVDGSATQPEGPSLSRLEAAARQVDTAVALARGDRPSQATYAPTRIYVRAPGAPADAPLTAMFPAPPPSVSLELRVARSGLARPDLRATVIRPLGLGLPEQQASLAGPAAELPEPTLGAPALTARAADSAAERADAASPAGTGAFVGGLSLASDLLHVLALFKRRKVRLGLLLGSGLVVLALSLLGELRTSVVRARPLLPSESSAPSASAPSASTEPARAEPSRAAAALPQQPAAAPPRTPEGSSAAPEPELQPRVRAAGALLIAGRYEEALPAYAALAKETHQPVFDTIRKVLEQRLQLRCEQRESEGGEPCRQ